LMGAAKEFQGAASERARACDCDPVLPCGRSPRQRGGTRVHRARARTNLRGRRTSPTSHLLRVGGRRLVSDRLFPDGCRLTVRHRSPVARSRKPVDASSPVSLVGSRHSPADRFRRTTHCATGEIQKVIFLSGLMAIVPLWPPPPGGWSAVVWPRPNGKQAHALQFCRSWACPSG
jgi:hypothetical protein